MPSKEEIEKARIENAKKIKRADRKHRNKVNLHRQNTEAHELKKARLCWKLEQQGKHYITEARFKDRNLRADIYVLDDDELWEIETSKQELEDRKNKYPENSTYVYPLWEDSPEIVMLYEL